VTRFGWFGLVERPGRTVSAGLWFLGELFAVLARCCSKVFPQLWVHGVVCTPVRSVGLAFQGFYADGCLSKPSPKSALRRQEGPQQWDPLSFGALNSRTDDLNLVGTNKGGRYDQTFECPGTPHRKG